MARPPITAKGKLRDKQIEAALDYVEANATGGEAGFWGQVTASDL